MDARDKLRELREGRGLSQKDLADASSVHFNSISGIESGKRKPHPGTLRKLAAALDVEVEDLTGAPKGEASPSARTSAERRNSYLLGYEVLALNTAERLQESIDSSSADFELVEEVARLHEDLQRIAVEEIGLLQEVPLMPRGEVEAQQRVAAALDDLRSVVDSAYAAAISRARGQKAAVSSLGKLRNPKGGRDQERAKSA